MNNYKMSLRSSMKNKEDTKVNNIKKERKGSYGSTL